MLLVQLWEHPIDHQQPHWETNLAGNLYEKDEKYILQPGCVDVSSQVLYPSLATIIKKRLIQF